MNFIEHISIYGVQDEIVPKSINLGKSLKDQAFSPSCLFEASNNSRVSSELFKSDRLALFAFPTNMKLYNSSQKPFIHSFVLTDLDGIRHYGTCLRIYEMVKPSVREDFCNSLIQSTISYVDSLTPLEMLKFQSSGSKKLNPSSKSNSVHSRRKSMMNLSTPSFKLMEDSDEGERLSEIHQIGQRLSTSSLADPTSSSDNPSLLLSPKEAKKALLETKKQIYQSAELLLREIRGSEPVNWDYEEKVFKGEVSPRPTPISDSVSTKPLPSLFSPLSILLLSPIHSLSHRLSDVLCEIFVRFFISPFVCNQTHSNESTINASLESYLASLLLIPTPPPGHVSIDVPWLRGVGGSLESAQSDTTAKDSILGHAKSPLSPPMSSKKQSEGSSTILTDCDTSEDKQTTGKPNSLCVPWAKALASRRFSSFSLCRPPMNQPPSPPPSLLPLFAALPHSVVFQVLSCVLLERKILFVSHSLPLLHAVCESVVSLIFPLRWLHTYIPVLPLALCGILESPMPFICGVHRS
ncbi:hypothetical protein ADUPG1_010468, partial [Aduncisulcus paluster]